MLAIDNYRFSLNISWQNYDQEDLLFIFSHKKQQNYYLEGSAREIVKLWIQNPGITNVDLLLLAMFFATHILREMKWNFFVYPLAKIKVGIRNKF